MHKDSRKKAMFLANQFERTKQKPFLQTVSSWLLYICWIKSIQINLFTLHIFINYKFHYFHYLVALNFSRFHHLYGKKLSHDFHQVTEINWLKSNTSLFKICPSNFCEVFEKCHREMKFQISKLVKKSYVKQLFHHILSCWVGMINTV